MEILFEAIKYFLLGAVLMLTQIGALWFGWNLHKWQAKLRGKE